MATTEELLTILSKQFPGWNLDGDRGILFYLNSVQKMLCHVEAEQLIVFDETTGKLPVINTISGDYSYDLPSTVGFVTKVLIEAGSGNLVANGLFAQDYGSRVSQRPGNNIDISGIQYIDIPQIRSSPANEVSAAKIIFMVDPGTVNDTYRYLGYRKPTELVSDTIPLTIPPPYDIQYLLPATETMIMGVENKDIVNAYRAISDEFIPKMQRAFNKGGFGANYESEDRGF
ncbi:MAG TPA: hypothetical protein VMV77_09260 [Bacteroidales bacterium]|nr:hypothetical protein [Bacteroidales bacterium]